jgi:hypothetical protein
LASAALGITICCPATRRSSISAVSGQRVRASAARVK